MEFDMAFLRDFLFALMGGAVVKFLELKKYDNRVLEIFIAAVILLILCAVLELIVSLN